MEGKNLEENVEETKKTDNVLQEDEVIDYEKVVYDRDDFVDEESYINYKHEHQDNQICILKQEVKKDNIEKITPTKVYEFRDLKSHTAIQNFCISGNEIYITQTAGNGAYRISRCIIEGSVAKCKDSIMIYNGGHGQTLEVYTYNKKKYLLIGISNNAIKKEDGSMIYWSTQLMRIEYKKDIGVGINTGERLIYLSYSYRTSDKKIKSNGAVKRCDAAISADNNSLVIWQKLVTGEIQYNIYNFETINKLWDKIKVLSFKDNKALQKAWISSAYKINKDVYINSSFQGIEISNAENMYITSGKLKDKNKWLSKINDKGSLCSKKEILPIKALGPEFEIEGVKIVGENLYIAARYKEDPKVCYIEKVDKCIWEK